MSTDAIGLARRYAGRGPRYTSYPTAAQFGPLTRDVYEERLLSAAARAREPWSVYAHIPFCEQRCHFCACAVIATPQHDRVAPDYVEDVFREIDLVLPHIRERRSVAQLHLGGGTPTYLAPELLDRLYEGILSRFEAIEGFENSVEVDPRVTIPEHLDVMARHGVNRLSMGVQDFDSDVQELIGRHQSVDMTRAVVDGARSRGIEQINVDLVYGLPGQTDETIGPTVDRVLDLRPDRVALYGYAHVPWMRGNQRRIDTRTLPVADRRLEMFLLARDRFESAGYRSIGLDHFALPDDPLAVAYGAGEMRRNFMGYTVQGGTDMLGFGPTAIGDVAGALVQNTAKLSRYREAVRAGQLPVERGVVRNNEDVLRGRVIADLMCRGLVSREEIEREFSLDFDTHFAEELRALQPMAADGLLADDGENIRLTRTGRSFVRSVAMPFDGYQGGAGRYSTTV